MWLLVSKKDRLKEMKEFGVERKDEETLSLPLLVYETDIEFRKKIDEKTYLVNENSIKTIEKVPSHFVERVETSTSQREFKPRTTSISHYDDTVFRFNLYYNDGSKDELVEIHSSGDLQFYMRDEKQYLTEIVKKAQYSREFREEKDLIKQKKGKGSWTIPKRKDIPK
jgi:hypothetical protein